MLQQILRKACDHKDFRGAALMVWVSFLPKLKRRIIGKLCMGAVLGLVAIATAVAEERPTITQEALDIPAIASLPLQLSAPRWPVSLPPIVLVERFICDFTLPSEHMLCSHPPAGPCNHQRGGLAQFIQLLGKVRTA